MNLEDFLNESETIGLKKENKKLNPGQWATAVDTIVTMFQQYEPLKKFKINAKLTGSLVTFRAGNTIIGKININKSSIPDEKLKDLKKQKQYEDI